MKRNGLVFVPPEAPKRVILYPTQDSSQQQQQQPVNGSQNRPKTALITSQQQNGTTQSNTTNNNQSRSFRQHPHSSPPNGISKASEKPSNDEVTPMAATQPISVNMSLKIQNPYLANPFFRPKIVTNQPETGINGSASTGGANRDPSSGINSLAVLQSSTSSSINTNPLLNRGRTTVYPKSQNPLILSTTQASESGITLITAVTQDDPRRWAQSVGAASIARRVLTDERPNPMVQLSAANINALTNGDSAMKKPTSATDIVISLMDPLRAPANPMISSATNIFSRPAITRDDSTLIGSNAAQNDRALVPLSTASTSAAATANNNQNWKKALLANFQKNSRNMPTAKIFQSRQIPPAAPAVPVVTSTNPDATTSQQVRIERTMVLNSTNTERTFQANDTTPNIPMLMRKATESLRVAKQENSNTIDRSLSMQVPPSLLSNTVSNNTAMAAAATTTNVSSGPANPSEANAKAKEALHAESVAHASIPIPSALITAKPSVNVEQQRAIITRVMIRRDFVKSTESKPPMPTAANTRSLVPPQSAKPGGLPTNNSMQPAMNPESSNMSHVNPNTNRMYQSAQHSMPLSQKSLLQFQPPNPALKDPTRADAYHPQPQVNGVRYEGTTNTTPNVKAAPAPPSVNTNASFRSASLSAANAESKKKKEELFNNKARKRANSASAMSNDGMPDKDPFETEDEEYEAELEEESARSSESDVETDSGVSLDPAVLLSDKPRRVGNTEVKPGLIPSLFCNVPPTIRFCTESQRIEQLPLPLRKMMKWKMSSITPNIVKNTVIRSGFRLISGDEGSDWLGTWSRHMKPICFKAIREYQKVNHFPGSFQIGRKDRLWRNLSHMQAVHSRREFDFVPQTFVLPADFLLFKRVFDEITDTKESKWIIKPPASARGQGIRVISKIENVPKKRPVIVQKYIANPYLINGHKFDLRLYVYVTSHDPLRIYLFDDGLTRFASRKYSSSVKSLSDRFMHLTNYSINRYNSEYRTNNDSGACTGHKWSLKALWTYLKKRDVDVAEILERIKDLIIKTIISADAYINVLTKANVRRKFCVHELFGFDVILDENCKPYIVEVNISPSLHSNSPLDISVKGAMISDLLNLSGFMIPDRRDILFEGSVRRKPKLPKSLIFDRRLLPQALSTDEKLKHQYFTQRYHDEQARRSILDMITPDDLRILIESEDEYARRGLFERIFPTPQTRKYLKYFETPRYYNLLLNEWVSKYHRMEERGIAMLNTFCKRNIHIQHPATDPNHMWTQYQKLQGHMSHRDNDNTNGNGS